jgi:hypothetical protein
LRVSGCVVVIIINISTTIYNVISTNQSNDRLKNLLSHKPIRFTTEILL